MNMHYGEVLMHHDIKPSYVRMRVFDYLKSHMNHPTVDEIFQALSPELPTLSKTTVYNTLKLFVEKNLVRELLMDQQKHYDINDAPHAHFQCESCGIIEDLAIVPPACEKIDLEDYTVHQVQLTYRGLCKSCRNAA